VLATGSEATYFNPALLMDVEPGIQLGFFAVRQSLDIDLWERPPGADVTSKIYDARKLNPDGTTSRLEKRPLPTASLRQGRGSVDPSDENTFLIIGTAVPVLEDRIALGLHVVLPTRSFQTQRVAFSDEREQYFSNSLHYELYGDRFETNLISLAVASRPFDGLSLGIGATAASEARASNEVFVPDASDQRVTMVNTSVEVHTKFCPYAGVDVIPVEPLHLVGTLHYPYSNDTVGQNDLQLWNFEYPNGQSSFPQSFHLTSHRTPLRAALGAGWRPKRQRGFGWSAASTVLWTRWSAHRDRHNERPADPWLDTFSVSAGTSLRWGSHQVGIDTVLAPSPVPTQTGRSNYVDNDRAAAAVGYTIRWKLAGHTFEAGAQLQAHRLLPRSNAKSSTAEHPVLDEFPDSVDVTTGAPIPESAGLQSNNPGFPGFSSEGWLWAGGLTFTALL